MVGVSGPFCFRRKFRLCGWAVGTHLRDTLSPLATAENGPRDAAGVLALEEERLGLAVLETEDLAVGADEELALQVIACQLLC